MQRFALVALALIVLMGSVLEANAVVCARGVYRAGCAGPNGAVVTTHRAVVTTGRAVVAPAARAGCAWVNGVRVCR